MSAPRVLVTGADGFVASALLPLLRRRLPKALVFRAGRREAELSDPFQAARLVGRCRPGLVFHLAGTRLSRDPDVLWRDNVSSTLALGAALARVSPGARLVVAGSCAEYGPAPRGPVAETFPPAPETPYGRAKRAQTLAALSLAPEGLSVRVALLFNLSGPGTPETLAPGAFACQAARLEKAGGGTVLHGDLRPTRDFVDVRDAAEALLLLGLSSRAEGRYNVCSGKAVPMSAVFARILRAARAPLCARRDPARSRAGEVRGIRGSHARLTRETGWRPRITLDASLRDTLAWHRR